MNQIHVEFTKRIAPTLKEAFRVNLIEARVKGASSSVPS